MLIKLNFDELVLRNKTNDKIKISFKKLGLGLCGSKLEVT